MECHGLILAAKEAATKTGPLARGQRRPYAKSGDHPIVMLWGAFTAETGAGRIGHNGVPDNVKQLAPLHKVKTVSLVQSFGETPRRVSQRLPRSRSA